MFDVLSHSHTHGRIGIVIFIDLITIKMIVILSPMNADVMPCFGALFACIICLPCKKSCSKFANLVKPEQTTQLQEAMLSVVND